MGNAESQTVSPPTNVEAIAQNAVIQTAVQRMIDSAVQLAVVAAVEKAEKRILEKVDETIRITQGKTVTGEEALRHLRERLRKMEEKQGKMELKNLGAELSAEVMPTLKRRMDVLERRMGMLNTSRPGEVRIVSQESEKSLAAEERIRLPAESSMSTAPPPYEEASSGVSKISRTPSSAADASSSQSMSSSDDKDKFLNAVKQGRIEEVRHFASRVDINASGARGQRGIHIAVQQGNLEMLKLLFELGADIHATDNLEWSALHWAGARNFSGSCVGFLVNGGADVEAKDHQGRTPLHIAAKCGNEDAAKGLLKAGAGSDLTDYQGQMPGDVALTDSMRELIYSF